MTNLENEIEDDLKKREEVLKEDHRQQVKNIKENYESNLNSFCKKILDNLS
jgi:hypothetical protein